MDAFEVRMNFVKLLRTLNATQKSIQKVVAFAIKYYAPCGDDLWDCIMEAAEKGSVNSRMNLLHFLDSLCETSLILKLHAEQSGKAGKSEKAGLYAYFLSRDLKRIVGYIVPEGREGLPNLVGTKQILETWRHKRYIDTHKIDEVIASLDNKSSTISLDVTETPNSNSSSSQSSHRSKREHRDNIYERIEQDRERHKRLRERRWVQPTYRNPMTTTVCSQLACFQPLDMREDMERAMDIEFENDWETTSDWNPDDEDAIREETYLTYLGDPK